MAEEEHELDPSSPIVQRVLSLRKRICEKAQGIQRPEPTSEEFRRIQTIESNKYFTVDEKG